MAAWQLRLDPVQIAELAALYVDDLSRKYKKEEELEVIQIGQDARRRGALDHNGFLKICYWKTPRSRSRCRENSSELVAEATHIAFSTPLEELRTGVLQCLDGVGLPTASAMLHLCHPDPYPLWDFRALWSWGFDKEPGHTNDLWLEYVRQSRQLARKQAVDMRTLDRALWQYSKLYQKSRG